MLSGGMDMRLKIWSVEDGSCPVTLIGHTGGGVVFKYLILFSCNFVIFHKKRIWDSKPS